MPIAIVEQGAEAADAEPVNQASAIWTRPKSEIEPEQYTEFFHHVGPSFGEPWLTIHAKAEGKIEYTMLLFVPADKPFDLFHPDRKNRLKLYVRRVFITDECEDLVPAYLRFLRGVIDSEDLPLNISREVLQNNPLLGRIRGAVVKRVLRELEKKADKKPDEYAKFWDNFGAVIKEGIYEDSANRDRLLGLARFRSNTADGMIALSDYVGRMKENQQAIFYITGGDSDSLAKSPQLEGFAAKDVEVLLLADAVDDFWLGVVPEFDGKPFKSVTRGGTDLASLADRPDAKPAAAEDDAAADGDIAVLIAAFKQTLEGDVKDVRVSERLTDSPV